MFSLLKTGINIDIFFLFTHPINELTMITCLCDSYQIGSAGTHNVESMTQAGPAQLAACQIQQSSAVLVEIRKVSSLTVLTKGRQAEGGPWLLFSCYPCRQV